MEFRYLCAITTLSSSLLVVLVAMIISLHCDRRVRRISAMSMAISIVGVATSSALGTLILFVIAHLDFTETIVGGIILALCSLQMLTHAGAELYT